MPRILAVDPGEKRIGLAISDLTGTIANPLMVINHIEKTVDAKKIKEVMIENKVDVLIIGQALDSEGLPGPQARKSERLAEIMRQIIQVPVILWDESGSTLEAKKSRVEMGVKRNRRKGHQDQIAATIILQSYLDSQG